MSYCKIRVDSIIPQNIVCILLGIYHRHLIYQILHDITYSMTISEVKSCSMFGLTQDTLYLVLTGELWGNFCE